MSLAMLPEEDMLRVVKRDLQASTAKARGTRTLEELVRNLYEIREQRYSISYEEVNRGINSIAVPVVEDTRSGLPLTLISLAAPSIRLTEKVMGRYLRRMQAGARAIAGRIREGGKQSDPGVKPRRR
jgi:DNA-binding IclR family transcriptional regulator